LSTKEIIQVIADDLTKEFHAERGKESTTGALILVLIPMILTMSH
jgi:hypothetical protein